MARTLPAPFIQQFLCLASLNFQFEKRFLLSLLVCTLNEQGLWLGIMCGLVGQMLLRLSITLCTNWKKEVSITSF